MSEIVVTRAHTHNGRRLEPGTNLKVPQHISREAASELMRLGAARVTSQKLDEARYRIGIEDTLARIESGEWTREDVLAAERERPAAQQRKGILALADATSSKLADEGAES